MDRIPPEIWEIIFSQVESAEDFHKACRTSGIWRNYLTPSMPLWMFPEVFPLLLPYLSKNEVLKCRGVCMKWNSDIDNFLENNQCQRPVTNHQEWGIPIYRNEQRPATMYRMLKSKGLLYVCTPNVEQIQGMLDNARTHPNCPIVGRSVSISQIPELDLKNKEVLAAFGTHVQFFNIAIRNYNAGEALTHIMELLSLVPNVKKVEICGTISGPIENILEINDDLDNWQQMAARPAMLETLLINLNGTDHKEVKEGIIERLIGEKLKSISLNYVPAFPNLRTGKIVDLSVELDSDVPFQNILEIGRPIQHLALTLCGRVHAATIFRPVKEFYHTIKHFELTFTPEFYNVVGSTPKEWGFYLEQFTNRKILENVPNLTRVTLEGCRPLSLNFLCGIKDNLEYLHVTMENVGRWVKFLEPVANTLEYTEELDLLEYLKRLSSSADKKAMYQSNVWNFFPKLKILTVKWENGFDEEKAHEFEFKRRMRDGFTGMQF